MSKNSDSGVNLQALSEGSGAGEFVTVQVPRTQVPAFTGEKKNQHPTRQIISWAYQSMKGKNASRLMKILARVFVPIFLGIALGVLFVCGLLLRINDLTRYPLNWVTKQFGGLATVGIIAVGVLMVNDTVSRAIHTYASPQVLLSNIPATFAAISGKV